MPNPSLPRPRRSALYIPGTNLRALEKARTLAADVLIFDLEDAVAPHAKTQARTQLCAALQTGRYAQECVLRINALDSPWGHDDVHALATTGASALLLPKVESAAQITALAHALNAAGAPSSLSIWAMCETPLGFLRLNEIASTPLPGPHRLAGLVVGTADLVKDLHARHTPERNETLLARSLAVMVARAYGLSVLDGVHSDVNDTPGLAQVCRQGRDLGFDGKTLIHPKQIDTANLAYGPSEADITHAHKLLSAWQNTPGQGVILVDGVLVESLHIREAERVLALANAINASNNASNAS